MKNKGYVALIGLGAIGSPLAHLLYQQYKDDFVLLSDEVIAKDLKKRPLYINGQSFSPRIVTPDEKLDRPIDIVFICVKNYSLLSALETIRPLISAQTVILPLQNGVYSYNFFRKNCPQNIILEGYAQGPNTRLFENNIVYQNPGVYHIGKNSKDYKDCAQDVYSLLVEAKVPCVLDDDIRHSIWKKMMLNVAGNALTALTELDYMMFKNSPDAQRVCHLIMDEYVQVAKCEDITITQDDIEEIMNYFVSYKESKHTSMLEDVLNKRETENEYIAGYIYTLAKEHGIATPYTEMLYTLMKVKEQVYLGKLN